MRIGFTGTQEGMSDRQMKQFGELLIDLHATKFHHGDCIGADNDADSIARLLAVPVTIHPPTNEQKRAYCHTKPGRSVVLPAKPYLERNRDIVTDTELLIAAPRSNREEVRSGTWYTVRYARRLGRKVIILPR